MKRIILSIAIVATSLVSFGQSRTVVSIPSSPTPTENSIPQRKSGQYVNRTPEQIKADMNISGGYDSTANRALINSKLDKADTSSLSDRIDLKPTLVSSVSDLRTMSLNSSMTYQTPDGGLWRVDGSDNSSSDNTGTVVVNGSVRVKRVYDSYVNALWFNARGDSTDGGTDGIQDALDFIGSIGGGTVFVPDGVYVGTPTSSNRYLLTIPSNTHLMLSPNARIKVGTNNQGLTAAIYTNGTTNSKVSGGQILGDRTTHVGVGEQGFGVYLNNSINASVSGLKIKNTFGDGLYIGGTDSGCIKTIVSNIYIDSARRNGISIIACNGLQMSDIFITHTNGTAPEAGIDIESDAGNVAANILMTNIFSNYNAGNGFVSSGSNVRVLNYSAEGNSKDGFLISNSSFATANNYHISNIYCKYNGTTGIEVSTGAKNVTISGGSSVYNRTGILLSAANSNVTISNIIATNNTLQGFSSSVTSIDSNFNTKMIGCTFSENIFGGVLAIMAGGAFTNNTIRKNNGTTEQSSGMHLVGRDFQIIGNTIDSNDAHGIISFAKNVTISNNKVRYNSLQANLGWDNIKITNGSNVQVIANEVSKGVSSNVAQYGIEATSNASSVFIFGNAMPTGGGNTNLLDNSTSQIPVYIPYKVGINISSPATRLHVSGSDDKDTGPIASFSGAAANQVESGRTRYLESTSTGYSGGYVHYNGSTNTFYIGVHDASDAVTSSDIPAIGIARGTGNVTLNKGFATSRTAKADAAYTIVATDYLIAYTSLTTTRAVTLPSAASVSGQHFVIKDESGSASGSVKITIVGTVDGASNPDAVTSAYGTYKFYSNGSAYFTE
jgi:hypothetical protein